MSSPSGQLSPAPLVGEGLDFRIWDLFHACVFVAALALTASSHHTSTASRTASLVALALMAAGYAFIGRRLAIGHHEGVRNGVLYLAGAAALFFVAVVFCGSAAWALISMSIQAAMLLPRRLAVAAVLGVGLLHPLADLVASDRATRTLTVDLWVCLGAVAATWLMTTWVDQLADQSEQRRVLVAELQGSRAEVARLSREAGVMAERTRLAAEIHDTLAQGYLSILTLITAVERTPDAAARDRLLALAADSCRTNLREARAMVTTLTPAALADADLATSLHRLADEVTQRTDLSVTVAADDLPELPRPVEVTLLRAAQEALTNVVKHAQAQQASIELTRIELSAQAASGTAPRTMRLVITDDGVGVGGGASSEGMAASAPPGSSSGHGLTGLRRRVAELDGQVTIAPAASGGTTVTVEVPW